MGRLCFLPLLPAEGGGGWEKRAGVMRANAAAWYTPSSALHRFCYSIPALKGT